MPTLANRVTAVLIAAGVSVSTAAVLAAPAGAATTGALSFLPAKGLASTPMSMVIPKACPTAGTNVVAQAFGHGFPALGQTVVGNSTAGVSHKAPFVLPFQDTFTGFAADNGTTLSGPYRVTLRCINRLDNKTYASYTATVTFSDASHFTAPAPAPALIAAIQASEQPAEPPIPSSRGTSQGSGSTTGKSASPQTSSSAGATASSGATGTGGSLGGVAPAANASSRTKSGFPWQPTLIVAAFVLIGLGILMRIREVRRGHRRDHSRLKSRQTSDVNDSADPPKKSPTLTGSASANNNGKGHQS